MNKIKTNLNLNRQIKLEKYVNEGNWKKANKLIFIDKPIDKKLNDLTRDDYYN